MQAPGTNIHIHEITYISGLSELRAVILKLWSLDQKHQYTWHANLPASS